MRDIPGLDIGITKILWVSDKFGASRKKGMASRVRGVGSVCKWRSMLEEGTLVGCRGERPAAQHTGRHSRNPSVEKGGGAVSLAGTLMIACQLVSTKPDIHDALFGGKNISLK